MWMDSIKENCPRDTQIILIANKSDVAQEDRQVTTSEGQELSQKHEVNFFEVSALDGSNIELIFT